MIRQVTGCAWFSIRSLRAIARISSSARETPDTVYFGNIYPQLCTDEHRLCLHKNLAGNEL
jgi:hypothetical protein